jgi:hypothetical protein
MSHTTDGTTPFAYQYPHRSPAELAGLLRDAAEHPEHYGPGDTAALLRASAGKLELHAVQGGQADGTRVAEARRNLASGVSHPVTVMVNADAPDTVFLFIGTLTGRQRSQYQIPREAWEDLRNAGRRPENSAASAQHAAQALMAELADFDPDRPVSSAGGMSGLDVFEIVTMWAQRHGVDADGSPAA